MPDPDYINPVFFVIVATILWSIVIFGPKSKRRINAKRLDRTWNDNKFDNK